MEKNNSTLQALLIAFIKAYQRVISPILGPKCRFYPSCSSYAVDAIKIHGSIKGCWLICKRILKCQPLHPGGYDPVPTKEGTINGPT